MQKIHTGATVHTSIKNAWDHYTNPHSITGWAFASADWECPKAKNDLKVGGKFLIRMQAKAGNEGFDFTGTYTLVQKFQRIKYVMDIDSDETKGRECEITFEDLGNGFTHVNVDFDPELRNPIEMQRNGWQAILNNFKSFVEKQK